MENSLNHSFANSFFNSINETNEAEINLDTKLNPDGF